MVMLLRSLVLLTTFTSLMAASTIFDWSGDSNSAVPFSVVNFQCAEEGSSQKDVGCKVGESQLSLSILDTELGQVGLRLKNEGPERSVIDEIYLVDEAGLLRPDTFTLQKDGQVHFKRSKKDHLFPAAAASRSQKGVSRIQEHKEEEDNSPGTAADIALFRRKEVSRIGRFLRSNGLSNKGQAALTMLMKTTSDALDAELVAEAVQGCFLKVAVTLTSFKADPKAKRVFLTECSR